MTENQLKELLTQMTLDEKINQLLQPPGIYYEEGAEITGNIQGKNYSEKQIHEAGSVLGIYGAKKTKEIQKKYIGQHPHHIPLMFMLDVIHGFRTIFPIPLAQGAAFDPGLAEVCSQIAAAEAALQGVHVTFAPMADLARDARWGRVMESYGEDPYLNGEMTASSIKGFQGNHIGDKKRIAACVKHFAGYGAPTAGREYNHVELSEHSLREHYLPAYERGIEAGAELVMTSFNTLNGIPSSGNTWLMRDILRKQMGFQGVLISDWGALKEMIPHGYCENEMAAARCALEAGVDIDMASNVYSSSLKTLIEAGEMEEQLVNEAVYRILSLKNKLGLFENPYKDADEEQAELMILCKEHREIARKAVRDSFVLLKNEEECLPLNKEHTIALAGPYVDCNAMHSAWAITGKGEDAVTVIQAAEQLEEYTFSYAPIDAMLDSYEGLSRTDGRDISEDEKRALDKERIGQRTEAALRAAEEADTVVLFLGEHRLQSGEAASRAGITIPENQMELFRNIYRINQNIITVVFTGRPLELKEVAEKSKAVLLAWMPGTEGGSALMEILSGQYSPSGKLPVSFPYSAGQVPIFYSQYATGRPMKNAEDKTFYCSRYLDVPNAPLYPFGFGMSYTKFECSEIKLSSRRMKKEERIMVSIMVENTGKMQGSEVLQLYIRDVSASVVRPVKELKGFQKISLDPGKSQEVTFEITESMLRFHDQKSEYISEPGVFYVWIGNSSAAGEPEAFELVAG